MSMLVSNSNIWIPKVTKNYSQTGEEKIHVYSLKTRKFADMQVMLFHTDCNGAKERQ